jgi:hypothetical protein
MEKTLREVYRKTDTLRAYDADGDCLAVWTMAPCGEWDGFGRGVAMDDVTFEEIVTHCLKKGLSLRFHHSPEIDNPFDTVILDGVNGDDPDDWEKEIRDAREQYEQNPRTGMLENEPTCTNIPASPLRVTQKETATQTGLTPETVAAAGLTAAAAPSDISRALAMYGFVTSLQNRGGTICIQETPSGSLTGIRFL